jgi:O-antigen ligase
MARRKSSSRAWRQPGIDADPAASRPSPSIDDSWSGTLPARSPRKPGQRPPTGIRLAFFSHAAVACLLIASAFGVWVAAERASALRALAWLGTGAAVYVAMLVLAKNGERWRRTALVMVMGGAALSLYVALQYRHLEYADKVSAITGLGWLTSALFPSISSWAPFSNSVATLVEGLLPLACGIVLGRGSRDKIRMLAAGCMAIMGVGLLLSASRGAWIAEASAIGIWVFLNYAKGRRTWLVSGTAAIAAGLVVATLWSLSHNGAASAAAFQRAERLDLYRHSMSLVHDFLFTGIGLGDQFAMVLSKHALLIEVPFLTYPHNLFLDQWLELGLPGALTWVMLIAVVLVAGVSGERVGIGAGFRGAYLGLIATFVHGLSDARQSVDGWTWLPFFALLGLLAARMRRVQVDVSPVGLTAIAGAPATLLLVVVMSCWPIEAVWRANLGGLDEVQARQDEASPVARADALNEAERAYYSALEIDGHQPTAHRRLGLLAMAQGHYKDAVAHLEAAAIADPDNWTTRKALGLACTWAGDIERASEMFGSLHDPDIPGELTTWSAWRETRGEVSLAWRALLVSVRLRPDPEIQRQIKRLAALQ